MTIDEIKAVLEQNNTAYAVAGGEGWEQLKPCSKCGCSVFYVRRKSGGGFRSNGCWQCLQNAANERCANNSSLPEPAKEVDENGVAVYEGRACKVCGSKIRLAENAYGEHRGKCRDCAVVKQTEKEQGKEIRRFTVQAGSHAHKFVVDSVHRSGCVEVAPASMMEWLELKDLVMRCRLMNEQERNVDSGVHWELCHAYPADGNGTPYRGKATVENLVIAQFEQNRRDGNKIPDSWSLRQVVSVGDVRLIAKSHEAAKAWKERKASWATMTEQQKADWTAKEQAADQQHKELVREITRGFCDSLAFVERWVNVSLVEMLERVELQWLKLQRRMTNVIDAAIQRGDKVDYVKVREQRLTVDAFHGAGARVWIAYQTLQQIADAEQILTEQGMTEEQQEQLATVKRCAVLWAQEINQNPKQLVMGFTHPLLNVLGDSWTWGTKEDAHGQQWICVWEPLSIQGKLDEQTPFGENRRTEEAAPEHANRSWLTIVPEPVRSFAGGGEWQSTDNDYVYEQHRAKQARLEKEAAENEQKAAAEQRRDEVRKGIARKAEEARGRIGALYGDVSQVCWESGVKLGLTEAQATDEGRQQQAVEMVDCLWPLVDDWEQRMLATVEEKHRSWESFSRSMDGILSSWEAQQIERIGNSRSVFAGMFEPPF
ncbi:TPA: hypothetical protein ACISW0_004463 [Salmonella enterica subsp. enterica serovar Javiana]